MLFYNRFFLHTEIIPKKLIFINKLFSTVSRKRFYKEVTVEPGLNNSYLIKLDGRPVKTPNQNILQVSSFEVAKIIAREWSSQKSILNFHEMHLTNIANRCQDNIMSKTKEKLIEDSLQFLYADTLCFRLKEPFEFHIMQKNAYEPIFKWFSDYYQIELNTSYGLDLPKLKKTQNLVEKLRSYEFSILYGINSIADDLKSLILTMALIEKYVNVEHAVKLSRLEEEFQCSIWGNVDWAHDIERCLLLNKVSAEAIFVWSNMKNL